MKGDYVAVKCVDNGFTVSMNEHSSDRKRLQYVARNTEELHAILHQLFPVDAPEEEHEPARVPRERPTGFPFDGIGERQGDSH